MNKEFDVKWMDETIEDFPGNKMLYKLMCIMLCKRRLTYSNMYVFTYAMNKKKYKDNELELKEKIVKDLALIYYHNNKKLPDGFESKCI